MPVVLSVKIEGLDSLQRRLARFPTWLPRLFEVNFRTLGVKITRLMQRELEPVRYKGNLANSVSSAIDVQGLTLEVSPTAQHAPYVFYGTPPHWAPIQPLKEWASWKLGNEKAAYAVQRSIARYGTNRGFMVRGLKGAWISPFGVGLDFLRLVTQRGDFRSNLEATAKRLGLDLVAKVRE